MAKILISILVCGYFLLPSAYGLPNFPQNTFKHSEKSEAKCKPTEEVVFVDRCEDYYERVCYTTQHEHCEDVEDQNCRAIVSGAQVRKCFNVTELMCSLKEKVNYEIVQAVFTVQKCHKETERVCDTVYDIDFTAKDDYQCIKISNPVCKNEDKTVYEETCRSTVKFDCDLAADGYESIPAESHGPKGQTSHYNTEPMFDNNWSNVASRASDYTAKNSAYGSANVHNKYSNKNHGYAQVQGEPHCRRYPETKCYTTPRQVSKQVCEQVEEKVCEKLSERVPYPSENHACHDEEKRVCELHQKTLPKQAKKFAYVKTCRPVSKTVCENTDVKQLVPSCVPTTRKVCTSTPEEKCEEFPKKHCYKAENRIWRETCEEQPSTNITTVHY